MEVIGKVKVVMPEQLVTSSYKKRELVVTTEEQHPQHILIEFSQDRCDLLNHLKKGEPVKVSINLRGREWVNPHGETRYFNSIQGWRVEKIVNETPIPSAPASNLNEDEPDDLPF